MSLGQLGFDLKPAYAYAKALKIEGAKEVISTCAFCSCGCEIIMHVKDGKLVSSEGNPDYPVSEGALCAKGAAYYAMHVSDHRVLKPRYRAPGADKWEEKDWDWVLDRIAHKIKDTRDKDFVFKNDKGQVVNRWNPTFSSALPRWTTKSARWRTRCVAPWAAYTWTIRPGSDTAPL